MLSDRTLAYARHVTTALLGVDALYRADSGDEDGLAVLNMDTAGEFAAETFGSWQAARERFTELRLEAGGLPEPDRRVYYDQLAQSTLAFVEWRQHGLPFEAQLTGFLHVPAEAAAAAELDLLQSQIRALLDRAGYPGDLRAQCAAWEARHRVPAEDVPSVLRDLLHQAWDRTEERLIRIPAPRSDGMRVSPVSGVAFNARCDYLERQIEINTDPILTRPGLRHLAVHEGYPGHYVQFKLRETWYREGTAPADVLLSVVNTASSSVFEGIADSGMEVVGWLDTGDDRVQALLNRYRAGIGTGAAWRLHALGWTADAVRDWLHSVSLTGGEGWVDNRMAFIAAPSRAALIWSYWWGEPVVTAAWRAVPTDRRGDFTRYLYGRMHSNTTVGMFPC
ncbi:MAG: hypothetical protein OEW44_04195 [Gemmatimonadota bacterium]|nr:hypothetical protein [Gemmatimonadota bacterium]